MKKKWNKGFSRVLTMMLTWLGIGSASMLFVACYGTPPHGYQVIDDEDSVIIMVEDSVVTTATRTQAEADSLVVEE